MTNQTIPQANQDAAEERRRREEAEWLRGEQFKRDEQYRRDMGQ